VPTASEIATAHYLQQQRTVRRTADRVQAIWRRLHARRLDHEWLTAGPALVQAVTEGQQAAASPADAYLAAVIAADGAQSDPAGAIRVGAFAGQAADGRSLLGLLYEPVIDAKWRLEAGQAEADAMTGSLATLLRSATTEVADAGRTAAGAGIASNRAVTGYVRVLSPPSCARCVVLAGTFYRYNTGFQRHPHCDCVHQPVTRYQAGRAMTDPRAYFNSLSEAEQARVFTAAGAQAIRDGADIGQVVNARRGMYTADSYGQRLRSTYDSTTKRGRFFRLERQRAIERGLVPPSGKGFKLRAHRLLPEEIYARAGDRDELIAMLRRYGYLI
jgi:hypothetical protein